MEQTRRAPFLDFNLTYFLWCFALPIFAFAVVIMMTSFQPDGSTGSMSSQSLRSFVDYYEYNTLPEFLRIFFNNYLAMLIVVYFTPLALGISRRWARLRGQALNLSYTEKVLLYMFPGLFLVRQAVNIAVTISGLAGDINRSIMVTLTGIVLPHGLPELLVFSLAGAVGMEVTRKALFASVSDKLVKRRVLAVLLVSTAACAFLEVYLTPKVFALVMTAFS